MRNCNGPGKVAQPAKEILSRKRNCEETNGNALSAYVSQLYIPLSLYFSRMFVTVSMA